MSKLVRIEFEPSYLEEFMETVACNLCASESPEPIVSAPDYNFGIPGTFNVVRCQKCGLAYLSPRPSREEIGDVYPEHYGEHSATNEPNIFARAEAAQVGRYLPTPGTVLDVGCAAGYFLAAMSEAGWKVHGVEPDPEAARKAAALPGVSVRQGVLKSGDYPDGMFDAVTLWSVLEHLHDPKETLSVIRRLLKPSGFLFLVLPNFDSFERMLFGERWFALDVPRHLYHFGPSTIEQMLKSVGLDVVELRSASGHDTLKFSLRPKLRASYANGVSRTNDSAPRPTNGVVTRLRRTVNHLAVNSFTRVADALQRGSQLFAVAKVGVGS